MGANQSPPQQLQNNGPVLQQTILSSSTNLIIPANIQWVYAVCIGGGGGGGQGNGGGGGGGGYAAGWTPVSSVCVVGAAGALPPPPILNVKASTKFVSQLVKFNNFIV